MFPVLVDISTEAVAFAVVALIFASAVVRTRFRQNNEETTYLAVFLGLNVKWSEVSASLPHALRQSFLIVAVEIVLYWAWTVFVRPITYEAVSLRLYSYDMAIFVAFVVGTYTVSRTIRTAALGSNTSARLRELGGHSFFWLLVAGVAGSNVLYNLIKLNEDSIGGGLDVLLFWRWWDFGFVWYGGLIAGILATWYLARCHGLGFWSMADIFAPAASLMHAVGRLGCFAAGCCFGSPVGALPVGVRYPAGSPAWHEHLSAGLINHASDVSASVYPVQIFEALGEVLIFAILRFGVERSQRRFDGKVVLVYLLSYALLRSVLEVFRGDSVRGFIIEWPKYGDLTLFLSTSQMISILVAGASIVFICRRRIAVQPHG
jgi:prolipoprotein diacylglyceryl transferase